MEMKKNYKYAVACPTSMGVRITPMDRMQVHNSNMFYMHATSAESNVLTVSKLPENARWRRLYKLQEGEAILVEDNG